MPIDVQKLVEDLQRKLRDKTDYFIQKEKELEKNLKNGLITADLYQQGRGDLRRVQDEIVEVREQIKEYLS